MKFSLILALAVLATILAFYSWMSVDLPSKLIIIFGVIFSLFYGFNAVEIFQRSNPNKKYPNSCLSWWIHQRWINFIGSVIGWICVFILYSSLTPFDLQDVARHIVAGHILLFTIGVLGIMGFLPLTFWGLANSMLFIAEKITGKI